MRTKLFGVVSIYGVLIALAVLCAVILCQREGRRRGLPEDIGLDMALWAVPLGVVCARLYYVIFRWDYYAQNPVSILYFWQGGLAIYGGVIGGALGLYLLSRRRRISCLTLFDMAAPLDPGAGHRPLGQSFQWRGIRIPGAVGLLAVFPRGGSGGRRMAPGNVLL